MDVQNPARIERELQKQVLAASASGTRASLFNLVVFRQRSAAGPVDEALNGLLGKRPARILQVESGYDGPSEVDVSARCSLDAQDRGVCFEILQIRSGSDGLGIDPGCWVPLLIRSLPVYVWWLEPSGRLAGAFDPLETAADRFVLHSGFWEEQGEDPARSLATLAGLVRRGAAVADFSWHRLLPLRRWTARLFDPPENRQRLERIEQVELHGGRRSEALLLFLWLAARLGWTVEDLTPGRPVFRVDDRRVTAEHHAPAPLQDGFRLEFRIAGEGRLGLHCSGAGCGVVGDPAGSEHTVRMRVPGDPEILLQEVDAVRADPVLVEALEMLPEEPERG